VRLFRRGPSQASRVDVWYGRESVDAQGKRRRLFTYYALGSDPQTGWRWH